MHLTKFFLLKLFDFFVHIFLIFFTLSWHLLCDKDVKIPPAAEIDIANCLLLWIFCPLKMQCFFLVPMQFLIGFWLLINKIDNLMIKYRIASIRFEWGYVEMPFTFSNIYQDKLDSSNSMYFVLEWVAIFGEANQGIFSLRKNCSHSLLSPQVNLDLFAHRNTSLVIEQICEDFIWCLVKFMKRVEPQSGRHKHFTARSSESSAPHLTNVWKHEAEKPWFCL